VFSDVNTVVNAFQCAAYTTLAQVATVLDRSAEATTFAARAAAMRSALNTGLLAPGGNAYLDGPGTAHTAQHATTFPVALGVAEAKDLPALGRFLASGGMRSSPYAAQFLLDALFLSGQADAAHALMVDTGMRSWLHMIKDLGATTTMECWDPSLKSNTSFSHVWSSAPANVIARYVLGVQVASPGAAQLVVRPQPGPLRWLRGRVPTIRGPVSVAVERHDRLTVRLTTPGNTTTRVVLDTAALGSDPDGLQVQTEGASPGRSVDGSAVTFDGVGAGVTTVTG
jgi:alpha-L-rhamnosidase